MLFILSYSRHKLALIFFKDIVYVNLFKKGMMSFSLCLDVFSWPNEAELMGRVYLVCQVLVLYHAVVVTPRVFISIYVRCMYHFPNFFWAPTLEMSSSPQYLI